MRALSLAAVAAAVLFSGSALAADMNSRWGRALPVAPVMGWAGFYLGGNAGGGIGSSQTTVAVPGAADVSAPRVSMSGALGGVQAGFNWQSGAFVLGVETDLQFSGLRSSLQTPCAAGACAISAQFDQNVSWFGTARGRVGYAFDRTLIYATGGFAYANVKTDASATDGLTTVTVNRSQMVNGWTVGGGAEILLTPNWSMKAEYLYVALNDVGGNLGTIGAVTLSDRSRLDMNVVRAGVNYRF